MSTESYLVALDGSKDALNAGEVAWKLAKSRGATLTALTVVDTQSIWDVLGQGQAGLIGSGPYIAAFETVRSSLRSISDALLMAFETRSLGQGIETKLISEEGNLAEKVLHHTQAYDLIVLGRRTLGHSLERTLVRTSLSEKIAASAANPVLIVSSEPRLWKQARLVIDAQSHDKQVVLKFLQIAEDLQLEPEIFCTGEASASDELTRELKDTVPHSVRLISHDTEYGDEAREEAVDVNSATMLVIATLQRDGKRCFANGPSIREFVQSLSTVSLLVFPPAAKAVQNEQLKEPTVLTRN